jgi:hypothetical protein
MATAVTAVGLQFNGSNGNNGTMDDGRPLGDAEVLCELGH